jgi:ABC-type sugar transport system ATPase subunit
MFRLHLDLRATMIHVTHDQAEALAMGDRIAVMDRGRVVQVGAPLEVYNAPATRFVAEFVGSPPMNLLPCTMNHVGESFRVQVVGTADETSWTVPADADWAAPLCGRESGRVDLGIRPEHISVTTAGANGDSSRTRLSAPATVRRLEPLGHETIAALALGPHLVSARLSPHARFLVGDRVILGLDPQGASWFDPDSGAALRFTSSAGPRS